MLHTNLRWLTLASLLSVITGCASNNAIHKPLVADAHTLPTKPPAAPPAPEPKSWLLHLPGIAGERWVDHEMVRGLKDGGYDGDWTIYDWTEKDPGLSALLARERNDREATKIAGIITNYARSHPGTRILVVGHSAGTGLAVWALEKLPQDVDIDTLILLSSALSPSYDLTAALRHVRGKAYNFSSVNDLLVLGVGTSMLGTVDGVKTEAAGLRGFVRPPSADVSQYAKLVQRPYEPAWTQWGNIGTHIGTMLRPFSREVLAPLLYAIRPATRPAAASEPGLSAGKNGDESTGVQTR